MTWQGWMFVIGLGLAAAGLIAAWWRLTRRLARQEAHRAVDLHYRLLHVSPRPPKGRKLYEERKTDAP